VGSKLLLCPWCGEHNGDLVRWGQWEHQFKCGTCRFAGPTARGPRLAKAAWTHLANAVEREATEIPWLTRSGGLRIRDGQGYLLCPHCGGPRRRSFAMTHSEQRNWCGDCGWTPTPAYAWNRTVSALYDGDSIPAVGPGSKGPNPSEGT